MTRDIDTATLLAPIPGVNPAGEDLRYTQSYEELKEARRSEESLEQGDWKREVKTADWDRVIALSIHALSNRTKDLQIAVWLTEALIIKDGFDGVANGLAIIRGLLHDFWDSLYPVVEDGELEFRAAPLEFMNEKLGSRVREIPLTDSRSTPGYSWVNWQESRQVGYEADTRNKFGDVEEERKNRREDLIADGKPTAEEFDAAVEATPAEFRRSIVDSVATAIEGFRQLDETVDDRFGPLAPRLAEFRKAVDECSELVGRIYRNRNAESSVAPGAAAAKSGLARAAEKKIAEAGLGARMPGEERPIVYTPQWSLADVPEAVAGERTVWEETLLIMETDGLHDALGRLLAASFGAPSIREKNRFRLMMAKLCLEAGRPDLAKPIAEELHALIQELHLERWESPAWIAEVVEALYRCLTSAEATDDDLGRAKELFRQLCTMDVTRAMTYK
jgi:type VI secretion system protein ImpA